MIRIFLPLILLIIASTPVFTQTTFWRDISIDPGLGRTDSETTVADFRPISVDLATLRQLLRKAPEEHTTGRTSDLLEISLPLPGGSSERFFVYRSPVMMPQLAEKYPNIQSYRLIGVERANSSGRLAFGLDGISIVMQSRQGEVLIDAFDADNRDLYRVYFSHAMSLQGRAAAALSCGFAPESLPDRLEPHEWEAERPLSGGRSGGQAVNLNVYTLALACTGEYARTHGGTVESVLSSYNEALTVLNEIYERELSIRFMLFNDIEKLIWLDPVTDPFVDAAEGRGLIDQIAAAFTDNAKITLSSFDIGHLFTANCNDVGGVAAGFACEFGREKGVTCHASSNVTTMVRRIMAHEIGHQFTAAHSFTNCPPSQGAVSAGRAVEPGSGSTIMSYAGLCGSQNIIGDNDAYFHVQSLQEIFSYSRQGTGRSCATVITVNNNVPEAVLDYADGFHIPISTPFQLKGSGSDTDDENLTYCWEQFDIGPLSPLGDPSGNTPLFRSYPPTSNPQRIFPRIQTIVSGTQDRNEVLPDYERDLTFRLTVRDNHPGGGGVDWAEVAFRTTELAGPFMVLSPDTDRPMWEAGTYQEVVWRVSNTDRPPVNCRWVNILLSTDGGLTYPTVLAAGVPNSGSAIVPIPNIPTVAARVKVEAADNIFFQISSQNFRILPPAQPGFTMTAGQYKQEVCLPDFVEVDLRTQAFLGFEELIRFEIMEGLPQDAQYDFSPATVKPGESTRLLIDVPDRDNTGAYQVRVRAVVPDQDTIEQVLYLDVISNDFRDVSILEPVNGSRGIGLSTSLVWTESANADRYRVELADNPTFSGSHLLDAALLNEGVTQYEPGVILEENMLHYWRLRPINNCGEGDYLPVSTFHTENSICVDFASADTPVVIPGSGLPTRESVISVDFDGVISDLNIPIVKGNYQPVNSLRISLISPAGTEVIVFDENCSSTTDLNLGFDDDAPGALNCPPDDGIVVQPVNPLSRFVGEQTRGNWTLRVKVVDSGFGGVGNIGEWRLEFCASSSPIDPQLVTNDTLYVPPGQANPLMANILEAVDEDNTAEELIYTLVQAPRAGTLFFFDTPLKVGDTFRQASINSFNLFYLNDDETALLDSFIFVVEDGTGGWIPPRTFTIKMDANATVDADEPTPLEGIRLFPNPARSAFRLQLPQPLDRQSQLTLFDARGSRVLDRLLPIGEQEIQVEAADLPRGLYFLSLRSGPHTITRRLVLQ